MPAPERRLGETARFRLLLRRLLGLQFEAERRADLSALLCRRAETCRMTQAAYLETLARNPAELARLAEELTVTETSFFRNAEHMRAFEALLPSARKTLRILSAGCASGEEPYSLAMLARQAGAAPAIQAFDINPAALARAAAGRYSPWALRQTPAEFRARFFRRDGQGFLLNDEIKRMVAFAPRNLAADDDAFWQPGSFDIVFCRNVLMYFAPAAARRAVGRIARSLKPGGHLFLGHAETLRGLSGGFRLLQTHGTFYYRRADAGEAHEAMAPVPPAPQRMPDPLPPGDISWYGDILRASARIRALTGGSGQ